MTDTQLSIAPAIAVLWGISQKAAEVLEGLRASAEGCDDTEFQSVYLDNAIPEGMSRRSFAGYLSALEKKGLYKSQGDDFFGLVRM